MSIHLGWAAELFPPNNYWRCCLGRAVYTIHSPRYLDVRASAIGINSVLQKGWVSSCLMYGPVRAFAAFAAFAHYY